MGERDDAVHLMTIHGSKGLEFPIVIIARLEASIERAGAPATLELHPERGMAMRAVDARRRLLMGNLGLAAMRHEEHLERRAEELRLLYVAMTRAGTRLLLVGSVKLEQLPGRWEASPILWGEVASTQAR